MAEKTACYSTVVPFSCIPEEFLKPLILEDAGDYTIDDTQFPGITEEEHRHQPALILAQLEKSPISPRDTYPSHAPNISPIPDGGVIPDTVYQQQQHHNEMNRVWMNYQTQQAIVNSHQFHEMTQVLDNSSYKKPACETINKAREDLCTIISGIQHKEFPRSTNPFDAMPALLSAVSFDYMSNHASIPNNCQSRTRLTRQHSVKRRMVCHVPSLQKPVHPAQHPQMYQYTNDIENVSQVLKNGNSRKRAYQVDDLDDILQCEYGNTKRRRVLEMKPIVPQCWPYQKENLPTFPHNPMVQQFCGNMGIMGY